MVYKDLAPKDAGPRADVACVVLDAYRRKKEREREGGMEFLENCAMFMEDMNMRVVRLPTDVVPKDLIAIQSEMMKNAEPMQKVMQGSLRQAQRWGQMVKEAEPQFAHIVRACAADIIQRTKDLRDRSLVRAKLMNAQFEELKVQRTTPAEDSAECPPERGEDHS